MEEEVAPLTAGVRGPSDYPDRLGNPDAVALREAVSGAAKLVPRAPGPPAPGARPGPRAGQAEMWIESRATVWRVPAYSLVKPEMPYKCAEPLTCRT